MRWAASVHVLLLAAVGPALAVPSANEVAACNDALKALGSPGGHLLAQHPRLEKSMSPQDIADGWVQLGRARARRPLPAARSIPDCAGQLRLAYNVQVPAAEQIQQMYRENMTGHRQMFALEWKTETPSPGMFHVPRLQLGQGRNALQLVVLEQELRQGWAFDYVVQLDDDVTFISGNLDTFERFLQEWQPAIGLPAATCEMQDCEQATQPYHTGHFDHIVVAYRHDTHDALWPFDVRYDPVCSWASQWIQGRIACTYYPGYVLYDFNTRTKNPLHRKYENAKCPDEWCKFSLHAMELMRGNKVLAARCHRAHPWESRCRDWATIDRMNYLLLNASRSTQPATDTCAVHWAGQMCKAGNARNGTGVSFREPVDAGNAMRCGGVVPHATWPWMRGGAALHFAADVHGAILRRHERSAHMTKDLRNRLMHLLAVKQAEEAGG